MSDEGKNDVSDATKEGNKFQINADLTKIATEQNNDVIEHNGDNGTPGKKRTAKHH
jgi:hypothetical protein